MSAPALTDEMAGERLRWLLRLGWQLPAGACVVLVAYSLQYSPSKALSVAATGILVGAAAFIGGALLGFLFGIPRVGQNSEPLTPVNSRSSYTVNTNLEQISDWLTKILVGVGLIELGNIAGGLGRLLDTLTPAFGGSSGSMAVAGADLAFFSIWGFLLTYLLTRTFLTAAFRAFDVAELVERAAQEAVTVVEGNAERQDEADALALKLVSRQLNPSSSEEPVRFTGLVEALGAASAPIREQALLQAQVQRRASWEWRREDRDDVRDDKIARHARTVPLFRALADVQGDDPRVLAEYGYALKDDTKPDYRRSREVLSSAITLAEKDGSSTDWLRLNRALAGIRLRRDLDDGMADNAVPPDEIYQDLVGASQGRPRVRAIVQTDPEIQEWLTDAGLTNPAAS